MMWSVYQVNVLQEEFENTKNRQHNGQKKKNKGTNNDQDKLHIKLKIE